MSQQEDFEGLRRDVQEYVRVNEEALKLVSDAYERSHEKFSDLLEIVTLLKEAVGMVSLQVSHLKDDFDAHLFYDRRGGE